MTGAEFSGVDIDLLADYVGGALDGTPDEAVVAALITEDAAWRDAHAQLAGGVAAVSGQLQALGASAEPMPADVCARLDAALLSAGREERVTSPSIGDRSSGVTVGPAAMEPGSDGAAPDRHLVAVPSGSRSRPARRLRWAAPVGIAAGVLAFVGFGLQQQFAGEASQDTATSSGAGAEQAAPLAAGDAELALPEGSVRLNASGTDYRPDTLEQAARQRVKAPQPQLDEDQAGDFRNSMPAAGGLTTTSAGLDRLRAADALRACLDAIAAQHGAGEITPQTIDFARFNGAPALIVEFSTAAGSWVWASGPACGTPGVGAATLASVKVG
ncbi:hypothetical protein [Actinoplanes sp. NPDC049599]|uniref:hypothetical protein n=1 Tax=Actinoplanes sp. NPDC049599 TaxID=3363903 RepID=UPI0037BC4109